MQGANVVPRSPAMSNLTPRSCLKYISFRTGGRGDEARGEETVSGTNERHYFDNGVGASAGPLYCVCVCVRVRVCDRWEDVKAPLPLMLKPAL